MPKYVVWGEVTVSVAIEVEADSEVEAFEVADEEFGGISNFCGNGGTDKLIGVYGENESIEAGEYVKWGSVDEI